MATEKTYTVQRISIARPWNKDGDYDASMSVATPFGDEIKIKIPEDRVEGILDSVSDLILDALTAQFTNMKQDFQEHVEAKRLAALPKPTIEEAPAVVAEEESDVPCQ